MKPKVTMPNAEEDRKITAAAKADPDNPPLDDDFFERARRGRPALAAADKKKRVNVTLDQELIDKARAKGINLSARVNELLRQDLGQ